MLSKFKRISISIVILAGAAGCGGNAQNNLWSSAQPKSVTGITLKDSTSVIVGETETLYPIVTPVSAYDKSITWNSLNTAAATVDENGTVTGIAAGTAKITATTVDGGLKAVCSVTVSPTPVSLTEITVSPSTLEIYTGGTGTLSVAFTPTNATDQNLTWSSSDKTVATVEESGLVTAVAEGSATITATSADGNHTSTCAVTVKDAPTLSTLIVSPGALSPSFNGATTSYNVTVDKETTSFSIRPTSSDSNSTIIVNSTTVANGYSAAVSLSSGTETIAVKLTAADGGSRTYTLTVTKSTEGTVTTPLSGLELVLAKAGTDTVAFPTGATDTGTASVTTPFLIATTETTYDLWSSVRSDSFTASYFSFSNTGTCGSSGSGSTSQPVTAISWEDAVVWCNALTHYYNTNTTGEDLTYAYTDSLNNAIMSSSSALNANQVSGATGFRLPTSAEWQYCARYNGHTAPTAGDLKTEYIAQGEHGGDSSLTAGYYWTPGNYVSGSPANIGDQASSLQYAVWTITTPTKPVKSTSLFHNVLYMYDMGGNVQEMCFDAYSGDSAYRSAWGGHYVSNYITELSVSSEGKAETNAQTGFRIVRSISSN
jgi:formylglycine-generating enzyme required for sulfatase activity